LKKSDAKTKNKNKNLSIRTGFLLRYSCLYQGDGNQFLSIGTLKMFPRNIFKINLSGQQVGRAVLSALPRKAVAFLTLLSVCRKYGTGCFVACGRRQGLLALDLGSIFEKLLHQKTFNFITSKIDFLEPLYALWNPDSKYPKFPFWEFGVFWSANQ
jgi:hypothetical protein